MSASAWRSLPVMMRSQKWPEMRSPKIRYKKVYKTTIADEIRAGRMTLKEAYDIAPNPSQRTKRLWAQAEAYVTAMNRDHLYALEVNFVHEMAQMTDLGELQTALVEKGFLVRDCVGCADYFSATTLEEFGNVVATAHKPFIGCSSGKESHCDCDECI